MAKKQAKQPAAQKAPKPAKVIPLRTVQSTQGVAERSSSEVTLSELIIPVLNGNTTYGVPFSLPINPGLATSFPLGSKQAAIYEKYDLLSLTYEYIPIVSGFAANGQRGTVVLMVDTDASDPPPAGITAALDNIAGLRQNGGPAERFTLKVDVRKLMQDRNGYYIRSGPISGDIKTFDCGNLHVVVADCFDTTSIGRVMATYRFRLRIPQLKDSGLTTPQGFAALRTMTPQTVAASGVEANLLWTDFTANGLTATLTNNTIIVLPVGHYKVSYNIRMEATGFLGVNDRFKLIPYVNGVAYTNVVNNELDGNAADGLELFTHSGTWYLPVAVYTGTVGFIQFNYVQTFTSGATYTCDLLIHML